MYNFQQVQQFQFKCISSNINAIGSYQPLYIRGLQFLILKQFQMDNEQKQRCDNCGQLFPESKIGTHFGYCRRNIKKCTVCHQMYDINFQEDHEEEFHKQETCPHCSRSFPTSDFKTHESTCPQKPKYCEYCQLNVPVASYPAHLKDCESRTKPCTKCNRPITNKEYLIHLVSCDGFKEEKKPRTYQEHIQEQRRVIENSQPSANSREKPRTFVADPRDYREQRDPRESKNRQQKKYAPIVQERLGPQGAKVISYVPPNRQEVKVQDTKYNRVEPKRQEPRVYNKQINPPPPTFSYKGQEEVRPSGKIYTNQPSSNSQAPSYQRQLTGSRDPKQIVSNKDIFAYNNGKATVKNAKSIERPNDVVKREERVVREEIPREQKPSKEYYPNPPPANIKRISVPEPKQRVIYRSQIPQPRNNNQFLNEEYDLGGALDMSYDHEMQMALMQSIQQKSKKNHTGYQFQHEFNDPELIAQQRAIEEQLKRNKQRR